MRPFFKSTKQAAVPQGASSVSNADEYAKIKATHPHVKVCFLVVRSCARKDEGMDGWMDGLRGAASARAGKRIEGWMNA